MSDGEMMHDYVDTDSQWRLKWCPGCNKLLPKNANHFQRNSSRHDGLQVYCKSCCSKRHKLRLYGGLEEAHSTATLRLSLRGLKRERDRLRKALASIEKCIRGIDLVVTRALSADKSGGEKEQTRKSVRPNTGVGLSRPLSSFLPLAGLLLLAACAASLLQPRGNDFAAALEVVDVPTSPRVRWAPSPCFGGSGTVRDGLQGARLNIWHAGRPVLGSLFTVRWELERGDAGWPVFFGVGKERPLTQELLDATPPGRSVWAIPGAPGCYLLIDVARVFRVSQSGYVDIPIPASPAFVGQEYGVQMAARAPGENDAGWLTSGALFVRIGM